MNEEVKLHSINKPDRKSGLTLRLSWEFISVLLLIIIVIMTFLWKPWEDTVSKSARKITVTGETTIKAEPDEYVLSPYFEFANADRTKATAELTTQSTATTAKLKELGVTDAQIKSNTNGYDKYSYAVPTDGTTNTLMLQYTITVNNKDLAQKVQDYLLTLKPKGQISPQAQFSEVKKKELADQARTKAIEDAKSKAEKTASQLGGKVGKAITISDGSSAGGPIAYTMSGIDTKAADMAVSSVPVQAGQNDYSYSVSVEYELK